MDDGELAKYISKLKEEGIKDELENYVLDLIDDWHNGKLGGELHENLGMTLDEYSAWVHNEDEGYLMVLKRIFGVV